MRWLGFLVLLVACERGHDPAPSPPTPRPAVAPISNKGAPATPDAFADWHLITPDAERLRCANYADPEWRVSFEANTIRATSTVQREPDSGPPLPFTVPEGEAVRGRRHVLAVSDGFLVGHDAGEWGGSLFWFSADGKRSKQLAGENVRGFVSLAPDRVVVFEGLAHLSLDEGRARWLGHDAKGWHETHLDNLDGQVQTFTQTPTAIYAATTHSLTRVDGPAKFRAIQPLRSALLYPDSMTSDAQGRLYLGMRQLVLRLVPNGDRFDEEWLAPPNCRDATLAGMKCICK